MKADVEPRPVAGRSSVAPGDVLLSLEHVSLSFGGVNALRDVSFDIRKGEIRAIIGPNGAGKTSMLNVINGFYHPQEGVITFKGKRRHDMRPYLAASQGIARTFQNVALFKGMSTLDNIMTGRTLKMRRGILAHMLHWGPAQREEIRHREAVERIIDFLEIAPIRKVPVGKLPYGLQKRVELGRALAMEPELLLLDEPMAGMNLGREAGHEPLHPDGEGHVRHHHCPDRARHGRGDGLVRPRGRPGLWPQDRGWLAGGRAGRPGCHRRLSGCGALGS